MRFRLNLDYLDDVDSDEFIDVEQVIASRLINKSVAGGNVLIEDGVVEVESPAVYISATSITGNTNSGLWEITVLAYCVGKSEYDALRIAQSVVRYLDGYGGNGIDDVEHISTIPQRNTETAPNTHTFAVSFRVLIQEN